MPSKIYSSLSVMTVFLKAAYASQDTRAELCYGSGDVAGAVIGTFCATLGLLAAAMLIYKWYWKSRKGKHLVLVTDAENPNDQYAFDNPCFREATPVKHDERNVSKLDKNRWLGWSSLHSFGVQKNEKLTSLDDSFVNDSHLKVVSLKGHDFTGLGFNICGNMRDGIFVKDVLHRGPAFESGCINSGDRIDSVCISFRNMVFEDALTILSYASPYEVQVQVENAYQSKPSTLIRSKRESTAVSSVDRIRHPKYNRSQSISHLAEIGKSNKWSSPQPFSAASDKNRINKSLNKFVGSQGDYPTLKITAVSDSKKENNKITKSAALKSPLKNIKTNPNVTDKKDDGTHGHCLEDDDTKMHKFGIKVLPVNPNTKMGIQAVTAGKRLKNNSHESKERLSSQNSTIPKMEDVKELSKADEIDGTNVKTFISKGLHNLKEKINQNSLGRKKNKVQTEDNGLTSMVTNNCEQFGEETGSDNWKSTSAPVPKVRSSLPTSEPFIIPDEVTKAGDVARNNRRSVIDHQEPNRNDVKIVQTRGDIQKVEDNVGSDASSEGGPTNVIDEAKRPKRSKGKAPAPPPLGKDSQVPFSPADVNAINKEGDLVRDDSNIFEPIETEPLSPASNPHPIARSNRSLMDAFDSDSDADLEDQSANDKRSGTKIELSATQVTIHHSPVSDASNEEEIETSRKAASLGDLSKLESDHTLSVVLERAVSLDLADGTSQCGKKRKAPLPPPEEFPTVFDEIGYRKEPRLENSLGLNTFQRRLKKSSDFGTLEDVLHDGPKSLEIDVKRPSDIVEANNSNIEEFSSWLAECRKQKDKNEDSPVETSKSLVNVKISDEERFDEGDHCGGNVTFSVNGKSSRYFESDENHMQDSGGANWNTVLVISQPNSLESIISECFSPTDAENELSSELPELESNTVNFNFSSEEIYDNDHKEIPPKLPTSPIPVISKTTMSSPLSKSLTYVTEIKMSTAAEDDEPPPLKNCDRNRSISIGSDDVEISTGNPKTGGVDLKTIIERGLFSGMDTEYLPKSDNEDITVNHENITCGTSKRGSGFGQESKIPLRTMKSETGQKVLATIQSLAEKERSPKAPEVEYAGRVASLYSPASPSSPETLETKSENDSSSSFYLSTVTPKTSTGGPRKIPPTVPPRKMATSFAGGRSTVTVAIPPGKPSAIRENAIRNDSPSDRNIKTFSSFMPKATNEETETVSKLVNRKGNLKDIRDINGGHLQVQSRLVSLPVKTSATKIVFESKDLATEEL